MCRVIFEYDRTGYNIWIEYPDDEVIYSSGYSTSDDLDHNIAYYKEQGYEVTVTRGVE